MGYKSLRLLLLASVTQASANPDNLGAYLPRFIRENLVTSWDEHSLQRLDCRLEVNMTVKSAAPQDALGHVWDVQFSDGKSGVFHVPPDDEEVDDLEAHSLRLWGAEGQLSADEVESALVDDDGSLRFSFAELMGEVVHDAEASSRSDEQLGAGRASLPTGTARARQRLIEAVHTYGMVRHAHARCHDTLPIDICSERCDRLPVSSHPWRR
jgi:hypothetical protein